VDVLASKFDYVAATLPGVKQQREGEPSLGADWMRCLKPFDLPL
jgi:hypothetical protein